ncbi:MAG: hypothetical protein R6X07_12290 [Desulfatiglandales bacterium]
MAFEKAGEEFDGVIGKRPEFQVIIDEPEGQFLARQNAKLNP